MLRMSIVGALVLGAVLSAAAQDRAPMAVHRLQGSIQIDGRIDEPEWDAIEPLPLIQYEPDPGAPATQQTEIRIAYDADYLYFSMRAFDRVPNGVRSNTLYRDRLSGDDHFEILVDSYNDNQSGIVFTTTPAGLRRDAAVSNDASGEFSAWLNTSFNTFWDVETVINDQGWFAELRIPFSSLKFQDENGRVIMGVSVQRKIARRSERLVFPAVSPSINWGFLRPSLAQKIVMDGVYSHNPLYVTPYAMSGYSHTAQLVEPVTGYRFENDLRREVGIDAKYGLTNNLTLDLTVNTDFAQVEADDQQVNLTRFSLFYPEKRQFFQERSGIFEFSLGGQGRLFHSRTIGLTETFLPVRILGGARVVGRIGAWDVGVLDMQTAEYDPSPSENFGVLRLRRRILNDYSFTGGMITSRIGMDGSYNAAYGLDGVFRLFGDDYLSVQWAQTFDSDLVDVQEGFNSGRFNVVAERRRRQGFGYNTNLTWSGARFDPGMGFFQRRDFSRLWNTFSYSWLPGERSKLLWHTLSVEADGYLRNIDRSVETIEAGPTWAFGTKAGSSGSVETRVIYEDLLTDFHLSEDALVPVGSYTFYQLSVSASPPMTNRRQFGGGITLGSFYDGWQATVRVRPVWYVSPHLELNAEYAYSRVGFPDRDQRFDAHLARLRIGTALNTELSTNALIQYNSASHALSANVRLRYNFREGNDLWIVYNEGLVTDRHDLRPVPPLTSDRTVMLKYTHTLAL